MKVVAYLVRHGETDLNKKNDFRGDLDVGLNQEGEKQSQLLIPFFANRQFSTAYISSRKRTRQTLQPLLDDKNMTAKVLKKLDSLDTGDLAGKPKSKKNLKELKYYRNHPTEQIPGGEKVADFRKRVDPTVMMIIRRGEESGKPTIACIHGSVVKEISRFLHDDMNKVKVEPGGVIGIFKSPNGYVAKALLKENDEEEVSPGS